MAVRPGRLSAVLWPFGGGDSSPSAVEVLFSLPTPVLVIDSEIRVRLANAAAETLFNRSQSSLSQVTLARLIPEAEAMLARAPASKPEDAGVAVHGLEIETGEGRRHRAALMHSPLVERPGWRVVAMPAPAPPRLTQRTPAR